MLGSTYEAWRAAELAGREARIAARSATARHEAALEARAGRWSRVCGAARLGLFAVAVVAAVAALRAGDRSLAAIAALATAAFVAVVVVHVRVLGQRARARARRILAEESGRRFCGGLGPGPGATLPEHPVSDLDAGCAVHEPDDETTALSAWARSDLGIDGEPPSLRTLLDTTQSELGSRRLLRLLRRPARDPRVIRSRQDAVRELATVDPLREALAAEFFAHRGAPQSRLPAFLAAPRRLPGGVFRWAVHFVGLLCPVLVVLAGWRVEWLPGALACFAAGVAFHLSTRRRMASLRDAYLEFEPVVRVALAVAPILERHTPTCERLGRWRAVLAEFAGPGTAHRLPHVCRWIRLLHLHETGFFYGVVQVFTLWDLHWLLTLEREVKREPARYERLVGALADLEAHVALATYAAEQAGTTFPEILASGPPRLEIASGEHPLLEYGRAVPNDLRLGDDARLVVVTGSNMAGKSTFLRMVAANTLLAALGAPVRAQSMRLTPLALHASIHVRDSLADGKSSFLVEVERIHAIVAAAAADPWMLGLVDELFRGTNSRERLAAGREIARHLAGSGALFLLATHDEEMARLAAEEGVVGMGALHFREEIVDGAMTFTYRIRPGVSRTHNALRWLELVGFPPALVARARQAAGGDPGEG